MNKQVHSSHLWMAENPSHGARGAPCLSKGEVQTMMLAPGAGARISQDASCSLIVVASRMFRWFIYVYLHIIIIKLSYNIYIYICVCIYVYIFFK